MEIIIEFQGYFKLKKNICLSSSSTSLFLSVAQKIHKKQI